MTETVLPYIDLDLLKKLDELIPEKCPSIHDSERAIWKYAGKRELVNFLIHQSNIQNENLL